ncbi:MAG: orc1/cdc6 family replication initiation protein [Candidatus Aenigmarchaeota archaeon]|nr:orc1/cdc6 family replication initiation protein [Candidatus Aenigmarchaeota archaeon]
MPELQQIFNQFIESKPIFANRSILSLSFTPITIPHRENEIEGLGRILAPALKGGKPSNVFVYGKTGTGKTLVSKYVTEELEKASKTTNQKLKTVYINCKLRHSADTEYRLLAYIIKELGGDVPFTGLPTDKIFSTFYEFVERESQCLILIIDEIDSLIKKTGDGVLYSLTRMNQDLKKSKICIIGITNDLSFIETLDPRVRSSLNEEEIVFSPYNAFQLQEILRQRANIAFPNSSMEAGVIEKCSGLAAQEHGDARRALDLLRVAAEIAERRGEPVIKISNVDEAQEKIDTDRVTEAVKMQPRQSQAVLNSLMEASAGKKDVETGDVFEKYTNFCSIHHIKPLTHRRISDLIAELELFGIISSKVVSKGRYGRTRVISLSINDEIKVKVQTILKESFG